MKESLKDQAERLHAEVEALLIEVKRLQTKNLKLKKKLSLLRRE